jgi:hypothetical protein
MSILTLNDTGLDCTIFDLDTVTDMDEYYRRCYKNYRDEIVVLYNTYNTEDEPCHIVVPMMPIDLIGTKRRHDEYCCFSLMDDPLGWGTETIRKFPHYTPCYVRSCSRTTQIVHLLEFEWIVCGAENAHITCSVVRDRCGRV